MDALMNALEVLTFVQDLLDLENALAHELIHVPLLRAVDVHLLGLLHRHLSLELRVVQACLWNTRFQVGLVEDKGVDPLILFDFLQVSILARILDVHLHASVAIRLWTVELEVELFLTDLSPLVSLLLPGLHLREDDAASASTLLGYNSQIIYVSHELVRILFIYLK